MASHSTIKVSDMKIEIIVGQPDLLADAEQRAAMFRAGGMEVEVIRRGDAKDIEEVWIDGEATDDLSDVYTATKNLSAAYRHAAERSQSMSTADKLRYVNMLTVEQFQDASSEFQTTSVDRAINEAAKYNERGVRGSTIHAVQLGDKFCVMLDTAAQTIVELGLGKIVS